MKFSQKLGFGLALSILGLLAEGQDMKTNTTPGAHIQRTMALLADSTPGKRNRVNILFYGQSITAQGWWKEVANDLKKRFPHADLTVKNRAIGGFTAPNLIATADYDVYPTYPDLLIFHVYGGGQMDKFEEIIRRARTRTACEVLLWTHHDIGNKGHYAESERIRKIALKYNCGLVDVEEKWQALLKEREIEPKVLLRDGIHLNPEGCTLLAGMIKPFLVRNPALMTAESKALSSEIDLSDKTRVKQAADGSVELQFVGNRVDAIAASDVDVSQAARVLIDGKSPAELPELYAFSKPSNAPYTWFPAIKVLGKEASPVVEDWKLDFTECTKDGKSFRYRLTGSVTGADGEGSNKETFVSNSRRIVIAGGANWQRVPWSLKYKKKEMPETFQVRWRVYPLFREVLGFSEEKEAGKEQCVTLMKGLKNGTHTLRLVPQNGKIPALRGFRVYCPAFSPEGE